jgi:hypothetical protein
MKRFFSLISFYLPTMTSLHKDAARVLDLVLAKKGTVKGLVLGGRYQNKKALYAVVCETLKCKRWSSVTDVVLSQR